VLTRGTLSAHTGYSEYLAEVPDRILHEPAVDLPLELAPALLDRGDLRGKNRLATNGTPPCEYSEYPL
jgi:hypothetical protein